jgi:hypothetical protein
MTYYVYFAYFIKDLVSNVLLMFMGINNYFNLALTFIGVWNINLGSAKWEILASFDPFSSSVGFEKVITLIFDV